MNTKYTPGPWHVGGSGSSSAGIDSQLRVWASDKAAVAMVATRRFIDEKGASSEMLANASLIAAAPDLLIALREVSLMLLKSSPDGGLDESSRKIAREISCAAIAKAEGK